MKSPTRKLLAATLALWLAPGALTLAAQLKPARSSQDAYQRVSDRLICQCGCSYGLTNCPHLDCPSAPVLRQAIRDKLAAGLSEEEVIKAMVADFGPAVLAAPPAEGFNLSAWVMPFVALLVGLYLTQRLVRQWRRRAPAAPTADPAVLERYRKSIEREMKELEE